METAEVVIIGGGVIGCAIAYHLAREGVRAAVLEHKEIGAEATRAAAGILSPLGEGRARGPFFDLALTSFRTFPREVEELQRESGVDVGYAASGMLRIALSEAEAESLKGTMAQQREMGLPLEWLGSRQVRSLERHLTPKVTGAIYSPQESQVDPLRLAQAYAAAAIVHGATVRAGVRVTSLIRRGDRVLGVRTNAGLIHADHVVLAAGPWTPALTRPLGWDLPMMPIRGQIIACRGTAQLLRHMIWGHSAYLAPKATDITIVGATVEDVGFRVHTTIRARSQLERSGQQLVPALAQAQVVDHWAGLRPGTADGMPILGPLPGWQGVSVAAGHFRNGILLAPITGRLAAQWITRGETEWPLAPFSPGRFAPRPK